MTGCIFKEVFDEEGSFLMENVRRAVLMTGTVCLSSVLAYYSGKWLEKKMAPPETESEITLPEPTDSQAPAADVQVRKLGVPTLAPPKESVRLASRPVFIRVETDRPSLKVELRDE